MVLVTFATGSSKNIVEGKNGVGEDEQHEDEGASLDYTPGFGEKWCTRHQFLAPHNSGRYSSEISFLLYKFIIS